MDTHHGHAGQTESPAEHPAHGNGHAHHELPTSGSALSSVALSATLHCLTGCAIGEVLGMIIGTALGFSDLGTIALAVTLAFFFGYTLTSLPLLRAGFALSAVIPIALASDTASIALMEIVDNAIMLIIPGAMDAGVGDIIFWGALSFALVVAGLMAFPLNRWLIARGKGHTAVHKTGVHGGLPPRVVGAGVIAMAIFGSTVLIAEGFSGEEAGHGGDMAAGGEMATGGHGAEAEHGGGAAEADPVRGLSASAGGMTLALDRQTVPRQATTELSFRIAGGGGDAVRDYEIEHEKRMHLIVARRDLTGFFHLHPRMDADGTWRTEVELPSAGRWRVFADFKRGGENLTLAEDLTVEGTAKERPLPAPSPRTTTVTGYEVQLGGDPPAAGRESELSFDVTRDGTPVEVEPYLGADGHLVALRRGDLAYLHVHPVEAAGHGAEAGGHAEGGEGIRFATEFPSADTYRLFLQFKHEGRVHTAAFTQKVGQ